MGRPIGGSLQGNPKGLMGPKGALEGTIALLKTSNIAFRYDDGSMSGSPDMAVHLLVEVAVAPGTPLAPGVPSPKEAGCQLALAPKRSLRGEEYPLGTSLSFSFSCASSFLVFMVGKPRSL